MRTHPVVADRAARRASRAYADDRLRDVLLRPLQEPPAWARRLDVDVHTLGAVRAAVGARAQAAGLDAGAVADLQLAVVEIAANTVRHGGGSGTLRVWTDAAAIVLRPS